MSGGAWEYGQWRIQDIADRLGEYIYGRELDEDEVDDYIRDFFYWNDEDKKKAEKYVRENHRTLPNRYEYSEETIAEFKKGLEQSMLSPMTEVYTIMILYFSPMRLKLKIFPTARRGAGLMRKH